ncbi:hypothetical protein OEZ86_001606 [Tetradesmus obliquus]|nr:hypothetical protein OEZ86_001606 [Tetradesmus obliquus]
MMATRTEDLRLIDVCPYIRKVTELSYFCKPESQQDDACGSGLVRNDVFKSNLNGSSQQGSCVTLPGHGYSLTFDGPVGASCPPGWFNPGNNTLPCMECPAGLITDDNRTACGNQQLSYVGCLPDTFCTYDPNNKRMQLLGQHSTMTVEACLELAAASGYAYAAVQGGDGCFGAHNISEYTGRGTCDARCSGNPGQMCGGACTHAIYRVTGSAAVSPPAQAVVNVTTAPPLHGYIGCYLEPTAQMPEGGRCGMPQYRPMPYFGDYTDLTIDKCVQLARAAGYKYAGVQYSRQCFGGNDISSFTLPGTCNMTCMGDPR